MGIHILHPPPASCQIRCASFITEVRTGSTPCRVGRKNPACKVLFLSAHRITIVIWRSDTRLHSTRSLVLCQIRNPLCAFGFSHSAPLRGSSAVEVVPDVSSPLITRAAFVPARAPLPLLPAVATSPERCKRSVRFACLEVYS